MALTQEEKTQIARVIACLEGDQAFDDSRIGIDDVLEILHHMIGDVEFSAEARRQKRREGDIKDMRRILLQERRDLRQQKRKKQGAKNSS